MMKIKGLAKMQQLTKTRKKVKLILSLKYE